MINRMSFMAAMAGLLLSGSATGAAVSSATAEASAKASLAHGRGVWFNNTYGGEKFFALLARLPDPQQRVEIGLRNVIETPRHIRFQTWGTINDPDCRANPAGGADICDDPGATGVVGIRRSVSTGGAILYGVSCASCHAGFNPVHPPRNVNEPKWTNIHPTIGNQYLKTGKIFAANLAPTDPRRVMLDAWPDGTVDTTLLFNDHIMNPSVITAFWEHRHRPLFATELGQKMRNGQGGEDDLGGDVAALRVFTNLGVCFAECVAPRPGRASADLPIDVEQCRRDCADFPPERDIENLVAFMASLRTPRYPAVPKNVFRYAQGRRIFQANCASCHVRTGEGSRVLSNDRINPLIMDEANATNACRALTSNWEGGHIWQAFSSQAYKARAAAGLKGYRTMPLTGVWATAPLLHNQSIGPYPAADAAPPQRAAAFEAAMRELMSRDRVPKVKALPVALGPFPVGTPLTLVFSRKPGTGELLCSDALENKGHYYGSSLSAGDKEALIYWLKFQ